MLKKFTGYLFTSYKVTSSSGIVPEVVTSMPQYGTILADFWATYPKLYAVFNSTYESYDFVDGIP